MREFQFQNGAIESIHTREGGEVAGMFQFQNGAIESGASVVYVASDARFNSKMVRLKVRGQYSSLRHHASFNSKMVRLKGFLCETGCPRLPGFQFQNGAIESFWEAIQAEAAKCFNSKMVRLKAFPGGEHAGVIACFNSKMVRLKARRRRSISQAGQVFQFQNGAIERSRPYPVKGKFCQFQFQNGAIESI